MSEEVNTTILGETLGLTNDIIKLVFDIIIYNSSRIINVFLSRFVETARNLLPQEGDDPLTREMKQELLNEIYTILQSEEFKQEWERFAGILNNMIVVLTDQLKDTLDNEVAILLDNLVQLIQKNTKSLISGVGRSAISGICSVPPLGAICAVGQVVQTSSDVGLQTFNTFMNTSLQVANTYSKLLGETAEPMSKNIQDAVQTYNYIMNTIDRVNTNISNVSNLANETALSGLQSVRQQVNTRIPRTDIQPTT